MKMFTVVEYLTSFVWPTYMLNWLILENDMPCVFWVRGFCKDLHRLTFKATMYFCGVTCKSEF